MSTATQQPLLITSQDMQRDPTCLDDITTTAYHGKDLLASIISVLSCGLSNSILPNNNLLAKKQIAEATAESFFRRVHDLTPSNRDTDPNPNDMKKYTPILADQLIKTGIFDELTNRMEEVYPERAAEAYAPGTNTAAYCSWMYQATKCALCIPGKNNQHHALGSMLGRLLSVHNEVHTTTSKASAEMASQVVFDHHVEPHEAGMRIVNAINKNPDFRAAIIENVLAKASKPTSKAFGPTWVPTEEQIVGTVESWKLAAEMRLVAYYKLQDVNQKTLVEDIAHQLKADATLQARWEQAISSEGAAGIASINDIVNGIAQRNTAGENNSAEDVIRAELRNSEHTGSVIPFAAVDSTVTDQPQADTGFKLGGFSFGR